MSGKKYIDVELENCVHNSQCVIPEPENIIFLAHWFDTNYTYKSEDMGHFYEIAYIDGEKVVAQIFNPGKWEIVKQIISNGKDILVKSENPNSTGWMWHEFYNKNLLNELRIEGRALIFRDKYRFKNKDFEPIGWLNMFFMEPDEFRKNLKGYQPEHIKDPLK